MKKTMAIAAASILCVSMFAGCSKQAENENADTSSVSETSVDSSAETSTDSASESESTSETSENSAKELELVEGDWTFEDCVTLPDYKNYEITKNVTKITDEDVANFYRSIMEPKEITDANATVENGDTLDTTYQFKLEGEDYNEAQEYSFTVGANTNIEGFEEGMIGHKIGDEVNLDLKFPEDYWDSSVAGKDASFKVVINGISRTDDPTDAWVQEYTAGQYNTVAEYDAYIRDYLESEAEKTAESDVYNQAWTLFTYEVEFKKLPKEYYDEGYNSIESTFLTEAQQNGFSDLESYCDSLGTDYEEIKDYMDMYAESYAKNMLVVNALWDAENLSEDDEIYKNVLNEIAATQGMTADSLYETYGEDYIKSYAKSRTANEVIINYANIKEVEA